MRVADLQSRFDLALRIRDRVSEANEAVLLIRGVNQQIDSTLARTDDPEIEAAAQGLRARLAAIEEQIYQVRNRSAQDPLNYPIRLNNKLAALLGHVESGEARPTDAAYQAFEHLSTQLEERLSELNGTLDRELPALNQRLRAAGLEEISRTPLEVPEEGSAQREGPGEEQDW